MESQSNISQICEKCKKTTCICKKIRKDYQEKLRNERLNANLCLRCGKNPIDKNSPFTRCKECREKRGKYRAEKRKQNILQTKCNNCGIYHEGDQKEVCDNCHKKALIYDRKIALNNKITVMNHYGNSRCNCCKIDILDMLTIDHINNNGSQDRKKGLGGDK